MARIRTIKPELPMDEELAELGFAARFFYINLWCQCDKSGRCEDRPKKLQALLLPWDSDVDADTLLGELHPKFVFRYEVGGRRYLQVINWEKHQRPKPQEPASEIPGIPEGYPKDTPRTPQEAMEGEREGEGKGKGKEYSSAMPPASSEQPIILFPVCGKNKEWGLTQTLVDVLAQSYPGIDVLAESRKALAWCVSNPKRRKTSGGMAQFLNGWMTRAQNSGTKVQAPADLGGNLVHKVVR